ncbi:MAG: ferrochelatase [Deltaproteobacteria bacterium CG11_big_fil_rev_8_21_14_0_20_47_16]|nr:MAG: ferrochelatase [Deltaproteobacteria bacterium CG11_big_fil_rev_8_21_14_0_20_47_16]
MAQRGILLVNLGSPDSPSVPDVRRYLREFLMDERVIDVNPWLRRLIVECTILPFRPKQSAHAYSKIWTDEGSPLIVTSRQVQKLLQEKLPYPVALGMRYGNPSIKAAIQALLAKGVDRIFLIPLYPHYAMSSVETVVVEVHRVLRELNAAALLEIQPPFYNEPSYINALIESAKPYLEAGYDHLLFSYHGLPERHLKLADRTKSHCMTEHCCTTPSPAHVTCYRHQVYETTRLFVEGAKIPKEKYSVAFQSRLGRDPWIQPYTDHEIPKLADRGVKNLLVMCPAFVSDCLETLEEIGMRAREQFLSAGGKNLTLIPCLNTHPRWVGALYQWIMT